MSNKAGFEMRQTLCGSAGTEFHVLSRPPLVTPLYDQFTGLSLTQRGLVRQFHVTIRPLLPL